MKTHLTPAGVDNKVHPQTKLAELLKTTTGEILIIGGDKRKHSLEKIRAAAFPFRVTWLETRESDPSPERFRFRLAHQDVVLVIALKGLMRHQHLADIHRLRRNGVLVVVLNKTPCLQQVVLRLSQRLTPRAS